MSTDSQPDPRRQDLVNYWTKSQDVAMHFNTLLQGYRLKAIGGIAIGAAIAIGLKLCDHRFCQNIDHRIVAAFFVALAVIWALVWISDYFYYYRLLAGAIDELLRIEKELNDVYLSHQIEHRVSHGYPAEGAVESVDLTSLHRIRRPPTVPSLPITIFYSVPLILLVSASIIIGCGLCGTPCAHECKNGACAIRDSEESQPPSQIPTIPDSASMLSPENPEYTEAAILSGSQGAAAWGQPSRIRNAS